MPADLPKPDPIVIAAYLDDVDGELDAATRLMVEPVSRFAAFHLQQAAEKLVKAVRLHRGLPATADHNVAALIDELAASDAWRVRLLPLAPLSAYATAYRYPSPTGKRKAGPIAGELRAWLDRLRPLAAEARSSLLAQS
jgi:HEPN domain-containing protein